MNNGTVKIDTKGISNDFLVTFIASSIRYFKINVKDIYGKPVDLRDVDVVVKVGKRNGIVNNGRPQAIFTKTESNGVAVVGDSNNEIEIVFKSSETAELENGMSYAQCILIDADGEKNPIAQWELYTTYMIE